MSDPKNPAETSLSLLRRARDNDQQAWSRIIDLYRPLVRYWCRQANCPDAEVEDMVQEVFTAAAVGLSAFRHDRRGDSFRGWLRGISRNQVLLYFRRNQGRPRPVGGSSAVARLQDVAETLPGSAEDETTVVSQFYRRAVEQVRDEFEHRTWHMFWRTVIDGRPTTAVAEEMALTPAAVREAKSRVLRRLKQEMGELLD